MMRNKKPVSRIVLFTLLLLVSLVTLFPFFWMLSTSLKDSVLVFSYPPKLIPESFTWSNYVDAWVESNMSHALVNSLFIAILSTAGNVIISSMAAYSFAKIDFKGRSLFFMIVLATIMIPFQVTLIPSFVIFKNFGWINTYYPLIVPMLFGSASNVFLMRQYVMRIPDAYREAAKIDGCGEMRIWMQVILPMSIPMLVSIAVLTFMGKWNEFLGPMLYLSGRDRLSVPIMLRVFQSEHTTRWNLLMAASCIALMPIMILYTVSQKYIIGGIMLGGIKG